VSPVPCGSSRPLRTSFCQALVKIHNLDTPKSPKFTDDELQELKESAKKKTVQV
jgi:hypothetical protein